MKNFAAALSVLSLLLVAPVLVSAMTKEVALTFDDGPYGTSTEQILSILKREQVPATFFVIGQNVAEYPQIAEDIVRNGNAIGNHTYNHTKHLTTMSPTEVDAELAHTESIIASTTAIHTRLFRPPYGNITKTLRRHIQAQGYRVVMWNVDTRDWDYPSTTSDVIVERVLASLKTHMIILLHDGRDTHVGFPRDNTITALPILIEDLKKRGYTFVKYNDQSTK